MANGGELLLNAGGRALARLQLDPGRHVERLHGRDRRHAGVLAPEKKARHGARIGAPCVGVADDGGEELEEAHTGPLAGDDDQARDGEAAGRPVNEEDGAGRRRREGKTVHHAGSCASAR